MKRFVVQEEGRAALPPLDLDGDVVIGSGPRAQVRLPASATNGEEIAIARDAAPGEYSLGNYRVRVEAAPAGAIAATPQRTESLARELMRGLLGAGGAPSLEVTRGPAANTRRELPPPEVTVIIGRGDEASWVILDEDLSRQHVEIVRGWSGTTIRDLGSKNGTRLGGAKLTGETSLADGARIELGNTELVFRDPAERHLQGEVTPPKPPTIPPRPAVITAVAPASRVAFVIAATICALATAGLFWVLAS
jgi:hypothetical protein